MQYYQIDNYMDGMKIIRNIPSRYADKVIEALTDRGWLKNLMRGTLTGKYSVAVPTKHIAEAEQIVKDAIQHHSTVIAALEVTAILKQQVNEKTGKREWCLVGKKPPHRVLRWFGVKKPSDEEVTKEEKRVQYFKHLHSTLAALKNLIAQPHMDVLIEQATDMVVMFKELAEIAKESDVQLDVNKIAHEAFNFLEKDIGKQDAHIKHCEICRKEQKNLKQLQNIKITAAVSSQQMRMYMFRTKYKVWLRKFVTHLQKIKRDNPWVNIKQILTPFLHIKLEGDKLVL